MQLKDFVLGCLQQHYDAMLRSVDGLTEEELAWMPTPQCSSIGFLLWHYGRTLDRWVHERLQGGAQLWTRGWATRLGWQTADPGNTGYGYTPEQLADFRVPATHDLLEYASYAYDSATSYLGSLSEADFGRMEVINPRGGSMTLGNMCQQLLWEFNQHGGQIAYLRGMQRGLESPAFSGGLLEGLAARETGHG